MPLPVPVDYPLLPLMQYDGVNPPYVPICQMLPSVERMRVQIAASVANEASAKAQTSAARMFCFNLFTCNMWNNQYFSEAVKLVADLIAINLAKGLVRDAELSISEAAQTVLTLYTSTLIFQYPDLKGYTNPNALEAASQNAPQLDNLKKEIYQMYHHSQGNGHYPSGHVSMHHGGPNMNHGGHYQGNPNMDPRMQHHQGSGFGHGGYPQGGGYPSSYPQQRQVVHTGGTMSGFGNGGSYQTPNSDFQGISENENGRFRARNEAHKARQIKQQASVTPVVVEPVNNINGSKELIIAEGTEMERAQHKLSYFGQSYSQDLQKRLDRFQETATEISNVNCTEDNKIVSPTWVIYSSLDGAITAGQTEQAVSKKSSGVDGILRQFVIVAKPIVCGYNMEENWRDIKSATSFVGMATKIQSQAAALEKLKTTENMSEIEETMNFLTAIDTRLTKLINDFIHISLGLVDLNIGSFAEDIHELSDYLHKTYGPKESKAFMQYESQVYEVLVEELDAETIKSIREELFSEESENDFPFIPENYSITHVFLNSRELGYRVNNEPVRINRNTAPALYRIIESLVKHKKEVQMDTLHDVLVTSDGVIYRVYRDYRVHGEFLISL